MNLSQFPAPTRFSNSNSTQPRDLSRPRGGAHPARKGSPAISSEEAAHDALLVQRFNAGDDRAFVEIMERYREKMFAIAFAHLRNRTDAEEIAQDTFVRAHRALGRFRGDASLATWLHRITVNLARNRYGYFFRRRRHRTLSLDCPFGAENDGTFAELIAADTPSPAQEIVRAEFLDLVAFYTERLDASHREILTLRNVLNRSDSEIAVALNLNVGTVKSRIARARRHLRAQIIAVCPEFSAESENSDWFEPARAPGRSALTSA
jgi:RNA polymerase sigma-70 factor (ECF subfamily)